MSFRSTTHQYGSFAKFLHWSIAMLFLVQYVVIYYRHWFTVKYTAISDTTLQLHLAVGISVVAFILPRIVWRFVDAEQPAPLPGSWWEHQAARLAHLALWFFMITMPLSGYLYSKNPVDFFGLFTIPRFGDTGLSHWLAHTWGISWQADIRMPMRKFHRDFGGALVVWILIALHAAAAFYHHFVRGDLALVRMLPGTTGPH